MGLYFKAQLQQMCNKLSDKLDGVDDHTQIAKNNTNQYEIPYLF